MTDSISIKFVLLFVTDKGAVGCGMFETADLAMVEAKKLIDTKRAAPYLLLRGEQVIAGAYFFGTVYKQLYPWGMVQRVLGFNPQDTYYIKNQSKRRHRRWRVKKILY